MGEAALMARERRNANVIAIEPCKCLLLNKKDYDGAI